MPRAVSSMTDVLCVQRIARCDKRVVSLFNEIFEAFATLYFLKTSTTMHLHFKYAEYSSNLKEQYEIPSCKTFHYIFLNSVGARAVAFVVPICL